MDRRRTIRNKEDQGQRPVQEVHVRRRGLVPRAPLGAAVTKMVLKNKLADRIWVRCQTPLAFGRLLSTSDLAPEAFQVVL